jgi:hypothetical protein
MSGQTDLATLISSMRPWLDPATYVWSSVSSVPPGITPVVTVAEREGVTVVVTIEDAAEANLPYEFPSARITLEVHSDLAAVGLTAAFARALSDQNISANVVAGFHHDHIFVPVERANDAMAALETLAAQGL